VLCSEAISQNKVKNFDELKHMIASEELLRVLVYFPEFEQEILNNLSQNCLKDIARNKDINNKLVFCYKSDILICMDSSMKSRVLNSINIKISKLAKNEYRHKINTILSWLNNKKHLIKLVDYAIITSNIESEVVYTYVSTCAPFKTENMYKKKAVELGYKDGKFPDEHNACEDDVTNQILTKISLLTEKEQIKYWQKVEEKLKEHTTNKFPEYDKVYYLED
jgi:hypothetical protein